jgi:hypothetical protein
MFLMFHCFYCSTVSTVTSALWKNNRDIEVVTTNVSINVNLSLRRSLLGIRTSESYGTCLSYTFLG